MTQEVCYRGSGSTAAVPANRLLQKDHSYQHDRRLYSTTLYHWDTSGVFQLREFVRSLYDESGVPMLTDYYTNPVNDANYTVKYRSTYVYDRLSPTGYVQAMRETFNDTITGSNVLLRTHSHTFGHERVSEKVTLVSLPNAPQTYFFVLDGLSNTRCLTSTTGAAVERYDYDAFGNAVGFVPANALTQYLYCGERFDSKLGWTYLRARYYDPRVGRFNRLDPFFGNLSDPQSLHKYTYCHGDPVNYIDPSGMFLISLGVGLLCGGSLRLKDGVKVGIGQTIKEGIIYSATGMSIGVGVGGVVTWLTGEFPSGCILAGWKLGFGLFVASRKGKECVMKSIVVGAAEALADIVPLIPKTIFLSTGYLIPRTQHTIWQYGGDLLSAGFQSFANGVYSEAMSEHYDLNEGVAALIQIAEVALASVIYDCSLPNPPTWAQIKINACEAIGVKAAAWLASQSGIMYKDEFEKQLIATAIVGFTIDYMITAFDVLAGVNYI